MQRVLFWVATAFLVAAIIAVALFQYQHNKGRQQAARIIAEFQPSPLPDLGSTRSLRILPLIDYHTADPALRTEVGVSYLIETDEHRILFDVGHNADQEQPSPLQQNMTQLGVDLADIDIVFISHNHFDHVGGPRWSAQQTFSLGNEQAPFPNPDTLAFVPAPMAYPGLEPVFADKPMQLGNGVGTTGRGAHGLASTGVIPRQLVFGWIEEQSLVIHVEGLGGILIVGCGHQPVPTLVARYEQVFDQPLYGIVGGLHLPVPAGRIPVGPLDGQRHFASGEGLFKPLEMADVEALMAMLKERDLGLIAVGGHDSSDEVIEYVREQFGPAHHYLRVGEEILLRSPGATADRTERH